MNEVSNVESKLLYFRAEVRTGFMSLTTKPGWVQNNEKLKNEKKSPQRVFYYSNLQMPH